LISLSAPGLGLVGATSAAGFSILLEKLARIAAIEGFLPAGGAPAASAAAS
jgi:hypothetical protein